MDNRKYVFIGNRSGVLERMLARGLSVGKIFVEKGSFLETFAESRGLAHVLLDGRDALVEALGVVPYDVLVSNGCPYVLPVARLERPGRLFINIHPSCLPLLRGRHPVNGAFLFDQPAGATCHVMDDKIDRGAVIAQIRIPLSFGVDLPLLYRMSFMAEADVFEQAYTRNFVPLALAEAMPKGSYYSRQEADLVFDLKDSFEAIQRKVKAFQIPSLGAYFLHDGQKCRVAGAQLLVNEYLDSIKGRYRDRQVLFAYDHTIVLKRGTELIRFDLMDGNPFVAGQIL